jgi:hypothetical protein
MQLEKFVYPAVAFLALAALPVTSHAAAAVPNFSIAGIPAAGFPHFDNTRDVTVTLAKNGTGATTYQLTATYNGGPFVFQTDPWTSYNVTGGSYTLNAFFSNTSTSTNPAFTSGTVAINGSIPGYSGPGTPPPNPGLLYGANLTAFGFDRTPDSTPAALGFKTDSPTGWAAQFQGGPESVYLYDFNVAALMSSFSSAKFRSVQFTRASAFTTVPLPAAVWLFGSALVGLAGVRRRPAASN